MTHFDALYIAVENIVRKGEIACNTMFLPYVALIFHFKCTLKCRLQSVLIWTSLKLCRLPSCKTPVKKPFENIVGKVKDAGNPHFSPFPSMFSYFYSFKVKNRNLCIIRFLVCKYMFIYFKLDYIFLM